jgi:hypothetical protein
VDERSSAPKRRSRKRVHEPRACTYALVGEPFADPRFAAGKPVAPPQTSIRLVADDVAVAKTYIEREGQQTVDGSELPYMDARDETTHEHHDL